MKLYRFFFLFGGRLDHVESFELYNDAHAFQLAQSRALSWDIEVWQVDYLVCRVAMVDDMMESCQLARAA